MYSRLLLDPASEVSGGGGTPAPALAPPPTNPPPPSPETTYVKVTPESLQHYVQIESKYNELTAQQQRALEEAEAKRLAEMVRRGEAEEALKRQRETMEAKLADSEKRHQELQARLHAERKAVAIADALAGKDFMNPAAARQVRKLIGDELETTTDASGTILVRQKGTGRPAADFIAEALQGADYAHFLKTTSRGGGGGAGATITAAPGPVPGTVTPSSPGEEAFALWWQQQEAARVKGYGPIGLNFASPPSPLNPRGPH
jgi:hypothetical protein